MGFLKNLFGKKEDATETAKPETKGAAAPQAEQQDHMYGVPLLTSPKVDGQVEYVVDMRPHNLSGVFSVRLPADWEPFESDRFRAQSQDEKTLLSVTLFAGKDPSAPINSDFFKDVQMGMFERFVTEGGYEPYDDLLVTDGFITQSFKVDDETQYYLTTARKVGEQLIIANIIIRDLADYSIRMRAIIQSIRHSMEPL